MTIVLLILSFKSQLIKFVFRPRDFRSNFAYIKKKKKITCNLARPTSKGIRFSEVFNIWYSIN